MILDRAVVPRRFTLDAEHTPDSVLTADTAIPLAAFQDLIGREDAPSTLGVILEPDSDLDDLAPHLDRVSFIAIHFPKFTDGRGYSNARLLRTRLAFRGTILAFGDVLRDQLLLLHRSGVNAFYMREDQDEIASLEAFERFADQYQAGLYPT
jgi:uncharacterized protein (DUF934 family)